MNESTNEKVPRGGKPTELILPLVLFIVIPICFLAMFQGTSSNVPQVLKDGMIEKVCPPDGNDDMDLTQLQIVVQSLVTDNLKVPEVSGWMIKNNFVSSGVDWTNIYIALLKDPCGLDFRSLLR